MILSLKRLKNIVLSSLRKREENCNHESVHVLLIASVSLEPITGFCNNCKRRVVREWVTE